MQVRARRSAWAGWALACVAAVVLAACGGGSSTPPPQARGTVLVANLAAQVPKAQIDAGTQASGLQALSGLALCDVDVRYVLYVTRDPAGREATASTAVMQPAGNEAACSGDRPVVLYAHGTTTTKSKNLANVAADGEAALLMAMYAAQGYIVVAPNFLGYDQSSLDYHPYLNAEAQAVDMIDGLRAALSNLADAGGSQPSGVLFVTGYSQGGHVAMATHKVLERDHADEFPVTASGPMSGPYNLVGFGDVVTGPGPVNAGATIFVPMLLTSYQRSYGDIYDDPSEVYRPPFDASAPTLFPTDTPVGELVAQGLLPADPTFTLLYGEGGLLQDGFRDGYAASTYRQALQRNTLLGWTPQAAMALCGGALDPTVYFALNTPVAQADFGSRGVTVPAWDLEDRDTLPPGPLGDAIHAGFQAAKAAAGANMMAQYHGGLVPPFCTALVRGYFQQIVAGP